jgi:hypothetical protein
MELSNPHGHFTIRSLSHSSINSLPVGENLLSLLFLGCALEMTSNSTIPPDAILNPYTPLAFLAPDVANIHQAMCYLYVAKLAVSSVRW